MHSILHSILKVKQEVLLTLLATMKLPGEAGALSKNLTLDSVFDKKENSRLFSSQSSYCQHQTFAPIFQSVYPTILSC